MSLSLQTETLLVLFDRLDPDKQDEFVEKLLDRLSPHKLEQLCEYLPMCLKIKYADHLERLLKELGSSEELVEVLTLSTYNNAHHTQAFSFYLKVASSPFMIIYNIEKNPKSMEIKVISSAESTLNQLIIDNKNVIYDSLFSFCKKSEN